MLLIDNIFNIFYSSTNSVFLFVIYYEICNYIDYLIYKIWAGDKF